MLIWRVCINSLIPKLGNKDGVLIWRVCLYGGCLNRGLTVSSSIFRVMGLAKELTSARKESIITAQKLGHNSTEIAKAVGCHRTIITRCVAAVTAS